MPGPLPLGERIIWQGKPRWQTLTRQVFHTNLVLAYFGITALWGVGRVLNEGGSVQDAAHSVAPAVVSGALVLAVFALLAWLAARTCVYTITNRRVLMRIGTALSKTIDIPFTAINAVEMKVGASGIGSISIRPTKDKTIPFFLLWPHVRPWRLRFPEPTLRALPNVEEIATLLTRRLALAAQAERAASLEYSERDGEVPAADGEVTALAASDEKPKGQNRSRVPLLAAAALPVLTVIAVMTIQFNKSDLDRTAGLSPEKVYDLSVRDVGSDQF
ncbi:MAG: photosynthetic complex putative assembly protein PuhB, partial [Pseudomonadota bacterium]